ncbi:MAG: anion permease, partial [Caulobacterales bacterium]|nr:anion permease [Caulobacterales bacterium]
MGPALALALQLVPPPPELGRDGLIVASMALLMATWWATEAIPIPATSLLPLVILPLTGVLTTREAAGPYAHPVVILLMGGFLIALALERWNLHARVALHVVARAGGRPRLIILGFMIAAALLSMWIS